jgi:hypothetical protein
MTTVLTHSKSVGVYVDSKYQTEPDWHNKCTHIHKCISAYHDCDSPELSENSECMAT